MMSWYKSFVKLHRVIIKQEPIPINYAVWLHYHMVQYTADKTLPIVWTENIKFLVIDNCFHTENTQRKDRSQARRCRKENLTPLDRNYR